MIDGQFQELIDLGTLATAIGAIIALVFLVRGQGAERQKVLDEINQIKKDILEIKEAQLESRKARTVSDAALHDLAMQNQKEHAELTEKLGRFEERLDALKELGCDEAKKK